MMNLKKKNKSLFRWVQLYQTIPNLLTQKEDTHNLRYKSNRKLQKVVKQMIQTHSVRHLRQFLRKMRRPFKIQKQS